jgi:hypothetical protein
MTINTTHGTPKIRLTDDADHVAELKTHALEAAARAMGTITTLSAYCNERSTRTILKTAEIYVEHASKPYVEHRRRRSNILMAEALISELLAEHKAWRFNSSNGEAMKRTLNEAYWAADAFTSYVEANPPAEYRDD